MGLVWGTQPVDVEKIRAGIKNSQPRIEIDPDDTENRNFVEAQRLFNTGTDAIGIAFAELNNAVYEGKLTPEHGAFALGVALAHVMLNTVCQLPRELQDAANHATMITMAQMAQGAGEYENVSVSSVEISPLKKN